MSGEIKTPEWLTPGSTTLLPKAIETKLPSKYRPICCLPTTYKLLTGIIADQIYDHLDRGNYMEKEQKGNKRRCLGTKDQLLINKTILEDCRKRGRNLSMAWIDYKKAFDSVPHSWIRRCMELYNINRETSNFLSNQMTKWITTLTLNHEMGQIVIPDINIRKGIFQGDSLSPLLFCLALDPLSKLLNKQTMGYNLGTERRKDPGKRVNHLLFMDDLKLFAENDEQLRKLLNVVHKFSKSIKMEFGLDKCAKCTIRGGKKVETENIVLEDNIEIKELDFETSYKCLGIEENAVIEHRKMREKLGAEYLRRVKKIFKSQLNTKK